MSKIISKGEQFILNQGLYVVEPINFMLLFNQNERDVLNYIRHCRNIGTTYISLSKLSEMTGLCENTIATAIKSLDKGGFISKGDTTHDGTHYEVNYTKLNNCIATLNIIHDPKERVEKAKELRKQKPKET